MADEAREKQILEAKKLYSQGSRNFLVKCYNEAADELSQVCSLYEEIYGELSDELGMPYLLYAKSLIALALEENKVIDVPEHESDDEDEEDEDSDKDDVGSTVPEDKPSGKESAEVEADTTDDKPADQAEIKEDSKPEKDAPKVDEEETPVVTSTGEENGKPAKIETIPEEDNEKPSTSNGVEDCENEEDDDNEAASSLQLAWEILELAAKIFTRQGLSGLPNLAEVQTELANIEFENNILDSAREDYEKALKIYKGLPDKYRRAMAEIYYKIGLTYLMQQMNQEGADSLKEACALIEDEISDIKSKDDLTDKDTENIKDMEETKQEIWAKIAEIEETRQQNIAEVRAALDNVIGTPKKRAADEAGPSSSAADSCSSVLSSKPTDISYLIKRKKTETNGSEAEEAVPPAKKPAV